MLISLSLAKSRLSNDLLGTTLIWKSTFPAFGGEQAGFGSPDASVIALKGFDITPLIIRRR